MVVTRETSQLAIGMAFFLQLFPVASLLKHANTALLNSVSSAKLYVGTVAVVEVVVVGVVVIIVVVVEVVALVVVEVVVGVVVVEVVGNCTHIHPSPPPPALHDRQGDFKLKRQCHFPYALHQVQNGG